VPSEVQPDFSGKTVKVLIDGPDKYRWWTFDEPQIELQHGRLFLVGRLTDPDPRQPFWGSKMIAYVAWDEILAYCTEAVVDRQQRKFGDPGFNTVPGLG
jgi:hypothetical protein